mgnify:CR=1 FL=1
MFISLDLKWVSTPSIANDKRFDHVSSLPGPGGAGPVAEEGGGGDEPDGAGPLPAHQAHVLQARVAAPPARPEPGTHKQQTLESTH